MRSPSLIDSHVHFWDPTRLDYPWLVDVPAIAGPHLIGDYERATQAADVEQLVFVQCECERDQYLKELEWVSELAKYERRLTGIVCWAPLERGDSVRATLDQIAAVPLVKGVRRIIQFESNPDAFAHDSRFIRGVQILAEYGLCFDICVQNRQLPAVTDLVAKCPDTRFVLDHLGKPYIKAGLLDPWRDDLKKLSKFDNVWCKMSGLVTEADHAHWQPGDLKPYVDHVAQCFGFHRLMYGGDWPVCTLASSYKRWLECLDDLLTGASRAEKTALFRDVAADVYRLVRR